MNFDKEYCEANKIFNTGDYVYKTCNYGFFEHLPGNREVLEKRVKKILKSIQNYGQIRIPIVINEKAQIIDGQARVTAFEQLGLPVYFTVADGASLDECIVLNKTTTTWKADDYLHSHAEKGNPDFIIFEQYLKQYDGKVSKVAIGFILTGNINAYNTKDFQSGKFKLNNSLFKTPELILNYLSDLKPYFKKLSGNIKYVESAIAFAYTLDGIDQERLANVIKNHWHEFPSYGTLEDWCDGISDVYNKHKQENNRIDIWESYKAYQKAKNEAVFEANEARRNRKR